MTDAEKVSVTVLTGFLVGRDLDAANLEASLRSCLAAA
jgi:hypothetical protein